ncbi:Spo0E like sporulation regulatory protein [Salsuginibacillus halophilus]|uniref:Spo0E like sporulation regulatory protein n=1 Tax=Salsuginibacillus halophilus TaxID=517424 RepID=A0A2P8H3Q6_9BACI|nr:aspartyl-phosphate phosphatase Spo0E family protein [Salsuginibacillus halophilus]PSL40829.1 Spo0E like sporulation regulatory protein [Salsuginibacillus halophilus]
MKIKALCAEIEDLRNALNETSKQDSLTSPEMIRLSHHLDELLNQYDEILVQGGQPCHSYPCAASL